MRDCSNNRSGFDRILVAIAASLLTVSATTALAQADQPRSSAAELAIDAAIPRPEPANVPPPTINDFKLDSITPATTPDKTASDKTETKPADLTTAPATDTKKNDTATAPAAPPPAAASVPPAASTPAAPATAAVPPA